MSSTSTSPPGRSVRTQIRRGLIACILLLTAVHSSHAGPIHFGQWTVSINENDALNANVTGENGGRLSIVCHRNKPCIAATEVRNLACNSGDTIPALLSNTSGVKTASLTCLSSTDATSGLYQLPDAELENIISGNYYAIAVGVVGGKFKEEYFTLDGALDAMGFLIQALETLKASAPAPVTPTIEAVTDGR